MGDIGLAGKLLDHTLPGHEADSTGESGGEDKAPGEKQGLTLDFFVRAAFSKDLYLILAAEKLALQQEVVLHAKSGGSPGEDNRIQEALTGLDDTEEILKKSERFVMCPQDLEAVPDLAALDKFCEFIKNRVACLAGRLEAELDNEEKAVLLQRKMNLLVAREIYISIQKETFGSDAISM